MSLTNRNAIELLIENMTSISLILTNSGRSVQPNSGLLRLMDMMKKSIDGIFRNIKLTIRNVEKSKESKKIFTKCSVLFQLSSSSAPDPSGALLDLVESTISAADVNFHVFRKYITENFCDESDSDDDSDTNISDNDSSSQNENSSPHTTEHSSSSSVDRGSVDDVITLKTALTNGYLYVEKAYFLVVLDSQLQLHSLIENIECIFSTIVHASAGTSLSTSPKELAVIVRSYHSLISQIRAHVQSSNWTSDAHTYLTDAIAAIQENLSKHIEGAQKGECDTQIACLREQVDKVVNVARSAFSINCVMPGISLMFDYPMNKSECSIIEHLDTLIVQGRILYMKYLSGETDLDISLFKKEIEYINDTMTGPLSPVSTYLFETLKSEISKMETVNLEALSKIYLTAFPLKKSFSAPDDTLICAYMCIFTIIAANGMKRAIESQTESRINYLFTNFVSSLTIVAGSINNFIKTHPDPLYRSVCTKLLGELEETRIAIMEPFSKAKAGDFDVGEDVCELFDKLVDILKSLSQPCYWISVLADIVVIDCVKIETQERQLCTIDDDNTRIEYFNAFLIDITQKITREVKFLKKVAKKILKDNGYDKTFTVEAKELLSESNEIMTSFVTTAMGYIKSPDDYDAKKEFMACMNKIRWYVQKAAFIFKPTVLSNSGCIVKLFKDVFLGERLAEFDECEICKNIIYNDICEIVNFVRRLTPVDDESGLNAEALMFIKFSCLTKIAVSSPAATEQFIESLVLNKVISSTPKRSDKKKMKKVGRVDD